MVFSLTILPGSRLSSSTGSVLISLISVSLLISTFSFLILGKVLGACSAFAARDLGSDLP